MDISVLGSDTKASNFIPLQWCSDGCFTMEKDGVHSILSTCNRKVEFIFFDDHVLAHVNSALGYSDYYPVEPITIDAKEILNGFEPPNQTWNNQWTYVMIQDPARSFQSLWKEKGYIDMISAKFENFTVPNNLTESKVCFFIDSKAFDHPVNANRDYLKKSCDHGEKMASEFKIPKGLEGEVDGLMPVILNEGEKLYVANPDFSPCEHAWSNIHPDNEELAVVNENSAVPLDLVTAKPSVKPEYAGNLTSARSRKEERCF